MPNRRADLGKRIAEWWDWFSEAIGVKDMLERAFSQKQEWDAIRSPDDLRAWMSKHGGLRPEELALKAKELGASDDEIIGLMHPDSDAWLRDPSAWIGKMMQDAHASPLVHEISESLAALALDPFLGIIVGDKLDPHAPEIEMARRFLGTIFIPEAEGWALSMLGQALSVGQLKGLGRVLESTKYTLGTCFTSWQTTSPIVQATILTPLQRLINRTFYPTEFTRSQWMDLFALDKIDSSRLSKELANLGYNAEKRAWLVALAKRQISRSDIFALWKKGIIGPVQVADRLSKMGYSRQAIEELIRLNKKEEASEEKGAYLGTLRKAFKEQLIGEDRLSAALKQQGRSDEAIALEIAVLKLAWEVDAKTAAKSDIRAAYMQDVIGRPEAEHWLASAGFVAHDVRIIVDTWDKQRTPAYKQINKSEILRAWSVNVLTQPEAYQGLRNVGYNERDATVLLDTYAKTHLGVKPPKVYTLKQSDIMWAWHTEVLNEQEALAELVTLGLTEDDAAIVFETFQRLHPRIAAKAPKELVKNDILEAWGRGILTEDETFTRLLAIGYVEVDADVLMRSYEARPEALPPKPTIAQLISSTKQGIISQAVLSQKLTVMGLSEESVQFYVSFATAPLPEKTKSLSRTDIIKLWVGGRYNRAWALGELLALGYSPENAENILWLARPEIEDTETYVLWKTGYIDDDVAAAMWSSMGFSDEQIIEMLG